MSKELVFIIGCFNEKTPAGLTDYCKIELYAKSEKEAIARAKKLIKRKFYESAGVIEVNNK